MATITKYYKGFSTANYHDSGGSLSTYNVDCVTQDLLNEIFTSKGDRVRMGDFGTRIPDMVFEFNDPTSQAIITEDLTTVFHNDPRVQLQALSILPGLDTYAIIAIAKLFFVEFNVTKDLMITVTSR